MSAQVPTKTCTSTGTAFVAAAGPATANCTLGATFTSTAGGLSTTIITVTSTGAGGVTLVGTPTVTAATGVVTIAPGPGVNQFTVSCTPAGAVVALTTCSATIAEAIAGTTVAGGATAPGAVITQTATPLANSSTAFAVTAVIPAAAAGTVTAAGGALPAGTVKTCSTAVPAPAGTFTCTVAVPAGVASPVVIAVTGATVTAATLAPAAAGTAVVTAPGTITITCNAVGGAALAPGAACPTAFTVTESLTATGVAGTAVTETFSTGGGAALAVAPAAGAPVITNPGSQFITTITNAGCVLTAAGTTAPAGQTAALLLGTTTGGVAATGVTTITAGQQVTCVIDLNDNEAAPLNTTVASGIVAVTTSTPVAAGTIANVVPNVGGIISQTGNTTTVRCGAAPAGANTTNTCDFVNVTFTAAQTLNAVAGLPLPVVLNVTYTSDIPAQDSSAQGQFSVFSIGLSVGAFAQPTGFVFNCPANSTLGGGLATTTTVASVGNGFPSQIGGVNVAGVGILPAALLCTAQPTVGGVAANVAPGTIEISSVNGTLLDANGNITTNLRIACGGASTVAALAGATVNPATVLPVAGVISLNTCNGVNFAVLGLGVGFVEIRARYEPTATAALAGIVEIEGATSVGFIAPPVNLSLSLNPTTVTAFNAGGTVVASSDPSGLTTVAGAPCVVAAAGATSTAATSCGVATLTFLGTTFTFTSGGVTQLFVNPANGSFIRNPNGSVLNGNVIFSSSDDTIARFVTPGTTAGTFTVAGAQATVASGTGNQVVVRCGTPFNAQTFGNPGVGSNFGSFFGGCTTASATYQGVNPGAANITGTFIADLPGAFGTFGGNIANQVGTSPLIGANTFALINSFQQFGGTTGNVSSSATLTVLPPTAAANTTISLVRGCNNVSPTVTESASAYAARVSAASALVSIFEYQPATNTFRGFSPLPGAPSDLATVTRLRPVFICVNAAATLTQPNI